jgi:DNA-binding transcriptional ArsR family regulator
MGIVSALAGVQSKTRLSCANEIAAHNTSAAKIERFLILRVLAVEMRGDREFARAELRRYCRRSHLSAPSVLRRNDYFRLKKLKTAQDQALFRRFLFVVYALTRICPMGYIKSVESVFEIIAEPNRRAILSLLGSSEQSVGEIERQLRMSQPAVSKHLRVLREAGFVESTVDAQRRLYRLKPGPLQELDAWLAQFRRFWSSHVDALERYLDRMDESAATRRKTGTTRRASNRERDKGEKK